MLRRLFVSIGFGWAVRAAGFLILVCLIIANFLVRSRLSPPGWTKRRQICDLNALKEPVYCVAIVNPDKYPCLTVRPRRVLCIGACLPPSHFSPPTLRPTAWMTI